MSLEDELNALKTAGPTDGPTRSGARQHPAGWEPGVAWDGSEGTITTEPVTEAPSDWDDVLRRWDLDPEQFAILDDRVQFRAWDAAIGDGVVQRMYYFRAVIVPRRRSVNVDELLAEVKTWRPRKTAPPRPDLDDVPLAFAAFLGDTQIGKPDGDGSAGTVRRVLKKTELAIQRVSELRRLGRRIDTVYLPQMGDCIEGTVSQGGNLASAGRLDLTLTEMTRVYRRLLLATVKAWAPHADRIIVPVVPGNHDEAYRRGNIQTSNTDSWAIDCAAAVADALELAPDGYGHVSFVFPQHDEISLTLDIHGTGVGLTHGHQIRGGDAFKWWANQAVGCQPIGDPNVRLLVTAHYHHLRVNQGGKRTHVQIPALDGGSTWWRHYAGQDAPAGMVTMTIGAGGWGDLAVL